MLERVVAALTCPHGEPGFAVEGAGLVCPAGHRFDIARQGYVNLLQRPAPAAADTAAMVDARVRVQAAGHHAALTAALIDAVTDALDRTVDDTPDGAPGDGAPGNAAPGERPTLIADLGAGTGHHLAAVVDRVPGSVGVALDVSKYAARRAVRAHARIDAVVCDVWQRLPLGDAAADVVLDVFAPRNVPEIARVLAPGAVLVVATPNPAHLTPLVERLGLLEVGGDKLERLDAGLRELGVLERRVEVERTEVLDHDMVEAMVAMGPSAHHLDAAARAERIAALPPAVEVTVSATLSTYRRI